MTRSSTEATPINSKKTNYTDSTVVDIPHSNASEMATDEPPTTAILNCFTTHRPSCYSLKGIIHVTSAALILVGFDTWGFSSETTRESFIGVIGALICQMIFWATFPR